MIKNNKVISLTIIGLVLGGIVGVGVNTEQVNLLSAGIIGGVVGFLAGWVWNTRSSDSKE